METNNCYCINPWCQNRNNSTNLERCQSCGTELLVNNRYRLVKPLRQLGKHPYTEVFEVEDIADKQTPKVLKVLIRNHTHIIELFEQEAKLLNKLRHEGIPKADPEIIVSLSQERELRCLVMEKIEGQNLEQWLNENGKIDQNLAIAWLEQLVEILNYVHQNNFFHRDIKPSNIMLKPDGKLVLIDFGTAREVTQTVIDGHNITRICSGGYTAPEQIAGRAVPQSDFFALGRTFVHLIAGIHPNQLADSKTDKLKWREYNKDIPVNLGNLIDNLIEPNWKKRPQNTKQIGQRLKELKPKNYLWYLRKGLVVGAASLLVGTGIYGIYWYLTGVGGCSRIGMRRFAQNDNLSCGEEILVSGSATQIKQEGVKAFATGDYAKAITLLEQAWQERRDPETLIYLNNARVINRSAYSIAIAVPIQNNRDSALEILRGVAQAQNEVNQGTKINGIGLKVLIADDASKPIQAQKIAEDLAGKRDILAVIGHLSSEVTLAAVPIYTQQQLVLISPGSTSVKLTAWGMKPDRFFFRTVPSDRFAGQALATYLHNQLEQQTATILYNPANNFSKSIREQFSISFAASGGQVVKEFDLSKPEFNPANSIDQAQKQGSTALVLLPDDQTSTDAFPNALKIINANQGRYWMVGGDTLYSPKVLQTVGQAAANRLVVAIPWHRWDSRNREFPQTTQQLWGGGVSWRTALAYDATRALITALEKKQNPNRRDVQQALSAPNFQAFGATGKISFNGGDRTESAIALVKVVPSNCSTERYAFVPVNYAADLMLCQK